MHVEAVSEGEKPQTDDDKIDSEEEKQKFESEDEKQVQIAVESETEQTVDTTEDGERPPELLSDHPLLSMAETLVDSGLDVERPDTELEERSMSPSMTQKRRSRSRGSKDLKGKLWLPPSPMPQPTGDSSSPVTLLMVPPVITPMPNFAFLQQSRFLRSPLQDRSSARGNSRARVT